MHTIYIRTLKRAEHTVFCVANGQKTYFDPQFNRLVPYSSGQQIKRSIIDRLSTELNEIPAPVTFLFDVTTQKEITEGEVFGTCDPSHFDQLLGGWMKAIKGKLLCSVLLGTQKIVQTILLTLYVLQTDVLCCLFHQYNRYQIFQEG